jgi:CRP-like cAMP-binding protein
MVTKGQVEIRISAEKEHINEHVATLVEGDFFGERGMLTGERREATVVAVTDAECYRLGKDAFRDILQRRPEIAEDIAAVLARRHSELEAAMENLNEEAQRVRLQANHGDFLNRIRSLFTL